VTSEFHVSRENEKARYEEHNNDPNDIGYRNFLARIAVPIRERFQSGASRLDFGCGSTAVLADILTENGFEMEIYDSFYETDKSVLNKRFDFVVSTEVVEHLSKPLEVFKKLFSLLKVGGTHAVMRCLYEDSIDFENWHYKNDCTHICFY
jgi:2-polyprenyl-3-methyl-5-hydroxy-6-metoxy-1,4-benzoquinol methylase